MKGNRNRQVATILGKASIGYLAVETASGPHVTPLLFAVTPDRLWFGIGRRTLKARALAKRPAVGVVVAYGGSSVAIRGEAALLDRLPPPAAELARAPLAFPVFASRNVFEMAAFARDVVGSGAQPQPLAPVSVRVDSLVLLDGWPGEAVLGWMTPDGPIALPAKWDERALRARVPASPLRAAGGARTAAACVCLDESKGKGPLAKRGRMIRGTGRARIRDDTAIVTLEPSRITRWQGFQTTTTAVAGT